MKKLMTMLAAVGMAFGLFADERPEGEVTATSFEGATEFQDNTLVTGGTSEWVEYTAEGATLAKGAANTYSYSEDGGDNPRYVGFSGTDTASLSLKTTFGNPLLRTLTDATVGDNGLYFDQLVKFTAFDDDPTIGANDKLALFVRDLSEGDVPVPATNLYAVAGHWGNDGEFKPDEEYDLGAIGDLDAWHRVTIKAVKATSTTIGFQIFVDGVVREADKAGYTGNAVNGLTAEAKALNVNNYLLPVRSQSSVSTLAYVGFDGQGSIDDLSVTTKAPFPACETKFINIEWDANVTKISYKVGEGGTYSDDITASPITEIFEAGKLIFIKPTFANNRGFDTISGMDFVDLGNGEYKLVPTADKRTATIVTKDATPRIKIGDKYYANFKDAIGAIEADAPAKLVLQQDVPVDADGTGTATEALIEGKGDITIDLNGRTITGTATGVSGYVITCFGNLIITNSQSTGGIAIAAEKNYAGVVYVGSPDENDRKLTIYGGQFDGAVIIDTVGSDGIGKVTSEVFGGKFLKGEESAFPLTPAAGYQATLEDDYWVVSEKAKVTIAITTGNYEVRGVEAGDEVYVGETITFTVAANAGYTLDGVTVNGGVVTPEEDEYSYTVLDADVTVIIAAVTTAIEWTITYADQYDEEDPPTTLHSDTFTVENYTQKEFWDGEREGFIFDGTWYDGEGNPLTTLAEFLADKREDVTIYGTWTPEVIDATVTLSYSDTEIASVTVKVGEEEPKTITETTFKAAIGSEIVITATAQTGYENVMFAVNGADAAATCEFTLEGNTSVTISATKKAEPVTPGDPITPDPGDTLTEINANDTLKAKYLKAPGGITTTKDYRDLFNAVDAGEGKIKFELNDAGKAAVAEKEQAADTQVLTAALDTAKTAVTVENPLVGFYYSLKQDAALKSLKFTDTNKLGGGVDAITFNLVRGTNSGFYQMVVTPVPVK